MFDQITLHDTRRPLEDRLRSRRFVGPYYWRPSAPNTGRGFYMGAGMEVDRAGSTFRLRIEEANKHLSGRASNVLAYWCDEFGDTTLTPIIARLPHVRGFLAGWTMGEGMASALDPSIYDTAECAAYAAHSMAAGDAEKERDREGEA